MIVRGRDPPFAVMTSVAEKKSGILSKVLEDSARMSLCSISRTVAARGFLLSFPTLRILS